MRVTASDISLWFGHGYSILKADERAGDPLSADALEFIKTYPQLVQDLFHLDNNPHYEENEFVRQAVYDLTYTRLREMEILAQRMRVNREWPK